MEKPETGEWAFIIAISAALIAAFFMFGTTGAKALAAFLVLGLPFYIILDNFRLEKDEKIFFAMFLGLAYFAIAVWVVNIAVPSLKISVLAAFAVLTLLGLSWKKLRLPKG